MAPSNKFIIHYRRVGSNTPGQKARRTAGRLNVNLNLGMHQRNKIYVHVNGESANLPSTSRACDRGLRWRVEGLEWFQGSGLEI